MKLIDMYCRGGGSNSRHRLYAVLANLNLKEEAVEKFHAAWCQAMAEHGNDGHDEGVLQDLLYSKIADDPLSTSRPTNTGPWTTISTITVT